MASFSNKIEQPAQFPKIFIDRLIATNPYAQRNGSQKGIKPNKLLRLNRSTPVLTRRISNRVIAKKPNMKIGISRRVRSTKNAIIMIAQ